MFQFELHCFKGLKEIPIQLELLRSLFESYCTVYNLDMINMCVCCYCLLWALYSVFWVYYLGCLNFNHLLSMFDHIHHSFCNSIKICLHSNGF